MPTTTQTQPAPPFTGRLSYRQTRNAGGWTGEHGFDVYSRSIYLGFVVPQRDAEGKTTGRWLNSRGSCVGKTYPNRYAAARPLR